MRARGWGGAAIAPLLAMSGGAFAEEDELVVTGERRPASLSALAGNVATIDADEIARVGADHASELLGRAPGVFINRNSGQEQLTAIRSPVLTSGAGAGSFLFLENGVPLRSAGFANVNGLFEAHIEAAERVEVIRGPSGALYGANAIHGVINVLTPAPTKDFSASLGFSGDTVERFKGQGRASGAAGAHGFHAALSATSEEGYRADSGLDQQKATLRHDFSGQTLSVRTIVSATNLNQETAGFVVGPDAYRDPVLRRGNDNPEAFRDAKAVRLSSEISFKPADSVEISVTPFFRWNEMAFLLHFFPSRALEENGHWSVGAQSAVYVDPTERLSLIAGLDWEYTDGYLRENQTIPTVGTFTQGLHYDFDVAATSVSGFAQGRYALAGRLSATIAARADWTRYDYENQTADGVVGRFLRPADRVDEYLTVSPKAGLVYDFGASAAYVTYARGARPPQTTDLYRLQVNQTADPADAETIDSIEAGWRGAIGPRIDLDVAAYFAGKRDFFFRDADGFNVSDGRTRHVGVETEASARVTDTLTIDVNASYARHTYRFERAVLSLPQASETISFGDDVDTAPRWLAGARALWRPRFAPVTVEAEWTHVGAYFADAANSLSYPGHDLFNLRADWRLGEHLTFNIAVRNVLDSLYAERADFAFGEERYFPGEERTFGFGLKAAL